MIADAQRALDIPRLINYLVPGGGLILVGASISGVLSALLFTLSLSAALIGLLLFPDDLPQPWSGLSLGVALGTYFGAQWRYAQTMRSRADQAYSDLRRQVQQRVRQALLDDRPADAWKIVQPFMTEVECDLSLAFLVAQVLTRKGDEQAALHAWRRVRRLDRHRIYYREIREHETALKTRPIGERTVQSPDSPSS